MRQAKKKNDTASRKVFDVASNVPYKRDMKTAELTQDLNSSESADAVVVAVEDLVEFERARPLPELSAWVRAAALAELRAIVAGCEADAADYPAEARDFAKQAAKAQRWVEALA